MEKSNERVSHPSHYTWLKKLCGVEVIDITRHMDFDLGNAVKYLLRAGRKSEEGYTDKRKMVEDLRKAIFYIKDEIKLIEGYEHKNDMATHINRAATKTDSPVHRGLFPVRKRSD